MMVPPIRGGTPTVDSGARSPSATAMRTSTAMSRAVSNAAIRARMGKGLSPVSMNGASAPRPNDSQQPEHDWRTWQRERGPRRARNLRHDAIPHGISHAIALKSGPCQNVRRRNSRVRQLFRRGTPQTGCDSVLQGGRYLPIVTVLEGIGVYPSDLSVFIRVCPHFWHL